MDSKPQLTTGIPTAPSHKPAAAASKTSTLAPPGRPTALVACTLVGICTFTTLYHAYQKQPVVREVQSYLVLLAAFVLAQRDRAQLWHHWRTLAIMYLRGVGTALAVWVFMLLMPIGAVERMAEMGEGMWGRKQTMGELVGWIALFMSWVFAGMPLRFWSPRAESGS